LRHINTSNFLYAYFFHYEKKNVALIGWDFAHITGFHQQPGAAMANFLHKNDLPDGLDLGPVVAIDCETMGLNPHRDRLCLVQMSGGDGNAHMVQIGKGQSGAPNLTRMLADPQVLKLFHFGRFDIAALFNAFGVLAQPVYCTKIASKLVRTYTDRHGLAVLLNELLGIDISKQQQMSDWGAEALTEAQLAYAASDVLYLHQLKEQLDARLAREGRADLARACFDFLPTRALLDLTGWPEIDIFEH
jgi:ribonuclease D